MSAWDQAVDAGIDWDAVRIPTGQGVPLLARLTADAETRAHLGPVVISDRSLVTYWPITTGTSPAHWPTGVRLLTRGTSIVLPGLGIDPYLARWLHRPHLPGQLTGATWLAAALTHTTEAVV